MNIAMASSGHHNGRESSSRLDDRGLINPNQLSKDAIKRMEQKYGVRKAAQKIYQMSRGYYTGRAVVKDER